MYVLCKKMDEEKQKESIHACKTFPFVEGAYNSSSNISLKAISKASAERIKFWAAMHQWDRKVQRNTKGSAIDYLVFHLLKLRIYKLMPRVKIAEIFKDIGLIQ